MIETVGNITFEVSTHLNDQEPGFTYARWTQAELIDFLNDGLVQVGTYRPDALDSTQNMTLIPGAQQTLPTGFSLLKSLDYNIGGACADAPIIKCDLNILRSFFKKPCLPTGGDMDYRVRTYAYDPRNPRIFYVSPRVPAWAVPVVSYTAVQDAPVYTIANLLTPIAIDQKYKNALISWMMMRAYEVDTESNTSARQAAEQRSHFYQMLGINYQQESSFNSNQFLNNKAQVVGVR